MEQLITLCNDAMHYPQNFAHRSALGYILDSYLEQLNEHQHRLFSAEDEAALDFRDLDNEGTGAFTHFGKTCGQHLTRLTLLTQLFGTSL